MGVLDDVFKEFERVVDEATNFVEEDLGGAVNAFTQFATYGLVGFDEETGRFTPGAQVRQGKEFVGELTGANAQRAALNEGNDRFLLEQKRREGLRDDKLQRDFLTDVHRSRQAEISRNRSSTSRSRTNSDLGGGRDFIGSDEQNFLGL